MAQGLPLHKQAGIDLSMFLQGLCRDVWLPLLLPALLRSEDSCSEGPRRVGLHELKAMHEALESDGAVIVTGVHHTSGTWEEKAAALPSLTFPGRLVSKTPKVQGIHLEHQHLKQNLTKNPFELVGKPLLPTQTDASMASFFQTTLLLWSNPKATLVARTLSWTETRFWNGYARKAALQMHRRLTFACWLGLKLSI